MHKDAGINFKSSYICNFFIIQDNYKILLVLKIILKALIVMVNFWNKYSVIWHSGVCKCRFIFKLFQTTWMNFQNSIINSFFHR